MRNGTRRVPVLLSAAIVIPLVALGWLGWCTLQQERELEGQRQRERLEVASERVALEIERRLQMVEEELARGLGVQFGPDGITSSNSLRVLFQPIESPIDMAPVGSSGRRGNRRIPASKPAGCGGRVPSRRVDVSTCHESRRTCWARPRPASAEAIRTCTGCLHRARATWRHHRRRTTGRIGGAARSQQDA